MSLDATERARRAGLALRDQRGPDYYRQIGARGGKRTAQRHGPDHMAAIGSRGLEQRIQRRWNGDRQAYYAWLTALGNHATDPTPWNGAFPHPGDEPPPVETFDDPDFIALTR